MWTSNQLASFPWDLSCGECSCRRWKKGLYRGPVLLRWRRDRHSWKGVYLLYLGFDPVDSGEGSPSRAGGLFCLSLLTECTTWKDEWTSLTWPTYGDARNKEMHHYPLSRWQLEYRADPVLFISAADVSTPCSGRVEGKETQAPVTNPGQPWTSAFFTGLGHSYAHHQTLTINHYTAVSFH